MTATLVPDPSPNEGPRPYALSSCVAVKPQVDVGLHGGGWPFLPIICSAKQLGLPTTCGHVVRARCFACQSGMRLDGDPTVWDPAVGTFEPPLLHAAIASAAISGATSFMVPFTNAPCSCWVFWSSGG